MAKKEEKTKSNTIAQNKKARFDYFIEERFEAGLALQGWEVKSLRAGKAQLVDSFVMVRDGEAWLHGTHRWASREHLPVYRDEYVFRHNRRGNPHAASQTLLGLSTHHQPSSYRQIIDHAA